MVLIGKLFSLQGSGVAGRLRAFARIAVIVPVLMASGACGLDQQVTNALDPKKDPQNPVAVITAPSQAAVRSYITLDGTKSYGHRNGTLTYAWALTEKPRCSSAGFGITNTAAVTTTSCLENATLTSTTSGATLYVDKGGYYTVTLSVTEKVTPAVTTTPAPLDMTSQVETLRINVLGYGGNHPPVAVARTASSATDVAALSASESYDIDGHPLSYSWKIMSPVTIPTEVELTNPYSVTAYLYNWLASPQSILMMLHVSDGLDYDEAVLAVTFN
ncbi:MAG: hypothetical protein HQK86_13690 [Nitrospinae bacterium]|nr:hypothetical protein [Nitrospinota bacterium]